MKNSLFLLGGCLLISSLLCAQPTLTLYNQNFAVVRDSVPLNLKTGINQAQFNNATMHLEPDSVVLRDPTGIHTFQILEQNYRADPVSQELLLSLFEGKTIDFESSNVMNGQAQKQIIPGKIIRSGYARLGGSTQPIIEVNGKLQFSLPGEPRFPDLGDGTILKPTLLWTIEAAEPAKFDAQLSYVTAGISWEASYNLVAPEKGDTLDLIGWVTMNNQSGQSFENATVKLMAGDVNKIQAQEVDGLVAPRSFMAKSMVAMAPAVTEKTFDEYHLYSIARPTTLLDGQTKQVEFVRATGIPSKPLYVYDGAQSNTKVWVMREFKNSVANHLGIPLPKGRVRFYRGDEGGQLEFTGENTIDHTPRDETIRLTTGNAFDIVGERKQTDYQVNNQEKACDESFEIKLRNHKSQSVEVRVVEHLYRWNNWEIESKTDAFTKTDAQTIEFKVPLKAGEEKNLSYTAHYSW